MSLPVSGNASGGGTRPTLETLEKLAAAVGQQLVVGFGEALSRNRSIAQLVSKGHAVIRPVD